jgi:hypothetical protein
MLYPKTLLHNIEGTTMHPSRLKFLLLAGITIAVALVVGCSDKNGVTNSDQIVGSGRLVTEQRATTPFTGIQVTGIGRVVITQDTVETLTVEADDNIIGLLTTSVDNGMLKVSLKDGSYNNVTVNVYASMKTINWLECIGAGHFSTDSLIQTGYIFCRITGAGSMTLKGSADSETVEITGAGEIHNFDFVSSKCSASISGAGSIEVNVTSELSAVIAGSGIVTYSGNPQIVNQTISGTGVIGPRH